MCCLRGSGTTPVYSDFLPPPPPPPQPTSPPPLSPPHPAFHYLLHQDHHSLLFSITTTTTTLACSSVSPAAAPWPALQYLRHHHGLLLSTPDTATCSLRQSNYTSNVPLRQWYLSSAPVWSSLHRPPRPSTARWCRRVSWEVLGAEPRRPPSQATPHVFPPLVTPVLPIMY